MRILILLILLAGVAVAAPNYELNNIRGTVAQAEQRLADANISSARHFVDSAKAAIAKAGPETKADPELAQISAKLAAIEKRLVVLEAKANRAGEADVKLREANSAETFGRIALEQDDYDKARTLFAKCLALVDEAIQLDPSARDRTAPGAGLSGAQIEQSCRENAKKKLTLPPAASTPEGKAALAAYERATKAATAKKLSAEVLVAGIVGADECRNKLGPLRGLTLRNRKPAYDAEKEMIGSLSMADLDKACAKLQLVLKDKKGYGCGRRYAGISQPKLLNGRFGPIETSSRNAAFELIECREMPKAHKFPGVTAKLAAKFRVCGPKAIYIVERAGWVDSGATRGIPASCYEKGELRFFK